MRVIPAAVETLLKSRAQGGASGQHNHLITLTGAPSGSSLLDPANYTDWITFVGSVEAPMIYGNMAETADGRAVIIYVESDAVKMAFADSVADVLTGTDTFDTAGATTLASGLTGARSSIALIDGKLNVCITHVLTELCAEFWRDSDGNGTSMAKVSDMSTDLSSGYSYDPHAGVRPSLIHKLGGGDLVVLVPYQDYIYSIQVCMYSSNNGATWTMGATVGSSLTHKSIESISGSFLLIDDTSFIAGTLYGSGYNKLSYFTESGAVKTTIDFVGDWTSDYSGDTPWFISFVTVGGNVYMCYQPKNYKVRILQLKDSTPTVENILSESDWDLITTIDKDDQYTTVNFVATTTSLIVQHSTASNVISGAGTVIESLTIRAKRIEVNRNKGMASSATVVFDNKGGIYSPDKEVGANWKNVMWPNNGIKIEQGYGSELITTFTGTIDDVVMTTFPAEITLICRDYLKRAYDQLITSDGVHSITYTNATPESMFTALATLAGWAAGDIHTEATGLTIAEKIFTNETYGDAFSWLADLCGFMVYCDEGGDVYFIKDDDDAEPSSDYEFAEGEDIISLGYTISDRDLYNKIIVIGDGVSYEVTYYNTYGILAGKKMIINANEATTQAQCQAIAEQARYLMNSRARICEFAAIANPYIQIKDTLTVTETTTLISELYNITDISTVQSPESGYIARITCYHYAAPAES